MLSCLVSAQRVLRGLLLLPCLRYCMACGKQEGQDNEGQYIGPLHLCDQERILTAGCDCWDEGKVNTTEDGRPDYAVGVVTRLRSGRMNSSIPCKGKQFLFSPESSDRFSDPPSLLFRGYRWFLPWGGGGDGGEDYSFPSSADVVNVWSSTSTSIMCRHGLHWDSITTNAALNRPFHHGRFLAGTRTSVVAATFCVTLRHPLWDFFPHDCSCGSFVLHLHSLYPQFYWVSGCGGASPLTKHYSPALALAVSLNSADICCGRWYLPSQLCCVGDPQGPWFPCLLTPIIVIHFLWERSLRHSKFPSTFPLEHLYFMLNHYLLLITDHVCGFRSVVGISF
jgi:hypothetical protein